jgi:hypothetical protein
MTVGTLTLEKNKEVYVVVTGEYSDFSIHSTTWRLDQPQTVVAGFEARISLSTGEGISYDDESAIQECYLDEEAPIRRSYPYNFRMNNENYMIKKDVDGIWKVNRSYNIHEYWEECVIYGSGKTVEKALKSARDQRMSILAELEGVI